jgi:hypothetical protein
MARRARKDVCRFCGDAAETDPDTWEPTGLCAAHAARPEKTARRAVRAATRREPEARVVASPKRDSRPNGPYRCVKTYRGEIWVNADGEPL